MPLNLSREMLQKSKILDAIKKKLVRKTIAMFQQLAEDEEKYSTFWAAYGTNIKLGVTEDTANRDRLVKLLRYTSSKTEKLESFESYVERMKKGQDQIYYLSAENIQAAKSSPLVETLLDKGYEVLFMVEPIDEYALQMVTKFDNKYKLTNLGKEGFQLPTDEESDDDKKDDEEDHEETLKAVIDFLKETLGDKLGKVRISSRLVRSPCALVAESFGYTATMEKVMRHQALATHSERARQWIGRKVMEINPTHPIILELNRIVKEDKDDPKAKDMAHLLLDTAALSSGYLIEQPSDFVSRVYRLLSTSMDIPLVPEQPPASATSSSSSTIHSCRAASQGKQR